MLRRKPKNIVYYWDRVKNDYTAKERFEAYIQYPAVKTADVIKKLPKYLTDEKHHTFQEMKDGYEALEQVSNFERITKFGWITNWQDYQSTYNGPTIKKCPSIINYLSRCLVIKAPCDFAVLRSGPWTAADDSAGHSLININGHSKEQYAVEGSCLSGFWNFKLHTGLGFAPQRDMVVGMTDPMYHNVKSWRVMQAFETGRYAQSTTTTINFLVPDDVSEVRFTRGEALAYMYFSEPHLKFVHSEKHKRQLRRLSLWGSSHQHDFIRGNE